MAHTSSKSTKKSGDKVSEGSSNSKSAKAEGEASSIAEQWVQNQSVGGPWDGIDEVTGEWASAEASGGNAYAASMAADQGSTKHKSKKRSSKK